MIELVAPAKLTVSLRVTGVRPDGMHVIDAEMVTLSLADRLVVAPAEATEVHLGGPAAGSMAGRAGADDLVVRALAMAGVAARVEVHKEIPAGAGLGGGSADAAAILRWVGWIDVAGAAALGADVAFCLVGGRARVRGIGEVVEPLAPQTRTYTLLTPPLHCSTPVVYRCWDELGGPTDEHEDGNDLTAAALAAYPELAAWRDELSDASGTPARLAGSGSTWFVEGSHPGPGRRVVHTVADGLG